MPVATRSTHTEESAEVEVLLANMDKLKGLTKKIQGSLGKLESSGQNVQDAIRPIYGNTAKLQITNHNIDHINKAIENLRQPVDDRKQIEDVIYSGLGKVELSSYLAMLDQANRIFTNLKVTNLKSNSKAIAEADYALKFGLQELEKNFRQTLEEEANPVEPQRYLVKSFDFPTISEDNSSKLRIINNYITNSIQNQGQTAQDARTVLFYADIRGQYVARTLQTLAAASVTTARKADPNAIYKRGTNTIGTYAHGIEKLFGAEYQNICPIFVREQWIRLHTLTCNDALSDLIRTLKELHSHVKSNILTDCFLAYEILDDVSRLAFRLEQHNPDLRPPIQDALRPIRETAKYSLQRLLDDCRNRVNGLTILPQDASPNIHTIEIMNRLKTMALYLTPLASILASVGEGGWRNSSGTGRSSPTGFSGRLDVGANGEELFSYYVADTIETLLTGLESKSNGLLKTKAAQSIFLANNVAVVQRLIAASDLSGLIPEPTRGRIDAWRTRAITSYVDVWKNNAAQLRDVQYTSRSSNPSQRPPSGSSAGGADSGAWVKALNSKDRDAIKEKFKNFNAGFEELLYKHKQFKLEPEIKGWMAREISTVVEPLYTRFYERYREIDKGKGKYVKYDRAQMDNVLNSL